MLHLLCVRCSHMAMQYCLPRTNMLHASAPAASAALLPSLQNSRLKLIDHKHQIQTWSDACQALTVEGRRVSMPLALMMAAASAGPTYMGRGA